MRIAPLIKETQKNSLSFCCVRLQWKEGCLGSRLSSNTSNQLATWSSWFCVSQAPEQWEGKKKKKACGLEAIWYSSHSVYGVLVRIIFPVVQTNLTRNSWKPITRNSPLICWPCCCFSPNYPAYPLSAGGHSLYLLMELDTPSSMLSNAHYSV